MSVSVNGWSLIASYSDPLLGWYVIPGTKQKIQLRKSVAPIFLAFATEWNKLVSPIDNPKRPDCWGFQPRPIAGTNMPSNHFSGTAADFCATRFPQHAYKATAKQRATIHALLVKYEVLEWGGDWSAHYIDEMHVQLKQSDAGDGTQVVSQADVDHVITKLRINPDGTIRPLPTHKPTPSPLPVSAAKEHAMYLVQHPSTNRMYKVADGKIVLCSVAAATNIYPQVGPKGILYYKADTEEWNRLISAFVLVE